MKTYEKYKDSGIEWIGVIPENWSLKRLKYLLREKITDGPHETPEFVSDGIPFLSVDSIKDGEIIFENTRKISEVEHVRFQQKCKIERNDILMGKAASVGKIARVKVDFEFSIWSPLALLKAKTELITSEFLEYYLKSEYSQAEIILLSSFNTQRNISMADIPKLNIVLPRIEEQKLISLYLDQKLAELNKIIENKSKLISFYEEEKQAIINQAVTKGLDPNVKMKDSGVEWLGEIPEHWAVKKIKYVGKFINGYSFDSKDFIPSGIRVIKISNIQNMRIDWTDESFVDEALFDKYSAFRIYRDDLIFALTRPIISTGIKATIVDCDDKMLLNQRNSVLRTDKGNIDIKWLYYIILNPNFIQEFDSRIDKTGQQPNISSNDIGDITIPVPSKEQQIEIIELIEKEFSRLDCIIEKFNKQIDLLKEYRTTLISEVVTGKIKVPNTIEA